MSYESLNLLTRRADKCNPKVAGWLSTVATSVSQRNLVVVGIEQAGSPNLVAEGHKANRSDGESSIILHNDEAARLYEFYKNNIAGKTGWFALRGTPTEYDCFGFARYVKGLTNTPSPDATPTRSEWGSAHPRALRSGGMYAIYNRKENAGVHAVLGIVDPSLSLSAMGVSAPLVVANNEDLVNGFGGQYMYEIIIR